jgi:hypothetical protein
MPSEVTSTGRDGEPGILRVDFPGFGGEGTLREIAWDEWFVKFDAAGLAFVYEDTTAEGERSNFNRLVEREVAQAREQGERISRRARRGGKGRGSSAATRSRRANGSAGGRRQASRTEAARATRSTGRSQESTSARGGATRARSALASKGRGRGGVTKRASVAGKGARKTGGRSRSSR